MATKHSRAKAAAVGYVYLLRCGEFHKIGWSKSVERRMEALQTASPYPIFFVDKFKSEDPLGDERAIHRAMKKYRARGEWFQIPAEVVADRSAWFKSRGFRKLATPEQHTSRPAPRAEDYSTDPDVDYRSTGGYQVFVKDVIGRKRRAVSFCRSHAEVAIQMAVDAEDDYTLFCLCGDICGLDYLDLIDRAKFDFIDCIKRYRETMTWKKALVAAIHAYCVDTDEVAEIMKGVDDRLLNSSLALAAVMIKEEDVDPMEAAIAAVDRTLTANLFAGGEA